MFARMMIEVSMNQKFPNPSYLRMKSDALWSKKWNMNGNQCYVHIAGTMDMNNTIVRSWPSRRNSRGKSDK